jgi:two-component system NtrC family sensor kinase
MNAIRLLLVDDEAVFLKTLADRLKKRGIPTLTADGGYRCLGLLGVHPMDVVVLDIKMPDLDGMAVLDEIKQRYPETEVILLTGHGSTEDGVKGIKAGAFDYLTKPVELDHLLKKITQASEKKLRDEEKKKEEIRRAAIEKQLLAAERLASLGILASGLAHEINNPLSIIYEWNGLLRTLLHDDGGDFPLREEFEKGFEKIDLAVTRAKQITQKLLGNVQKQTEHAQDIHPGDLLERTIKLLGKEVPERQVPTIEVAETCPENFRADPYPIQQVLLNIIINALDATSKSGAITCRISGENHRFVVFEIEDTGSGMPPEITAKIFDPFFTTKPTGEGIGLGLYMSRKIVEKLGGTIDVQSNPGHGSTFTICLPIKS